MDTPARRVRRMAGDLRSRVEMVRPRSRPLDVTLTAAYHDRLVGGELLACALAFRLFLWLLPAALVLAGLFGLAQPTTAGKARSAGLSSSTIDVIREASREAHRSRWAALAIGVVLLAYASVKLVRTVVSATSLAWGLPPARPRSVPLAAAATTVVLIAALALAGLGTAARAAAGHHTVGLALTFALVVVWAAGWWVIEAALPRAPEVSWRKLWPGAVLVGVGLQAIHLAAVLYLNHRLVSASRLYGSLGAAATLLLSAYLVSRLMISSAVLNATLNREDDATTGDEPTARRAPAGSTLPGPRGRPGPQGSQQGVDAESQGGFDDRGEEG